VRLKRQRVLVTARYLSAQAPDGFPPRLLLRREDPAEEGVHVFQPPGPVRSQFRRQAGRAADELIVQQVRGPVPIRGRHRAAEVRARGARSAAGQRRVHRRENSASGPEQRRLRGVHFRQGRRDGLYVLAGFLAGLEPPALVPVFYLLAQGKPLKVGLLPGLHEIRQPRE
jgi:hypothetical protein